MSVVVRMEMPENCECCPMVFTADVPDYHWCAALEQEVEQGLSRPKECPIICSLPEGHGRLVDADKEIDYHVSDFERVKTEGIDVYSKAYSLSDLCDGVTYAYDHANIIVPAERSET